VVEIVPGENASREEYPLKKLISRTARLLKDRFACVATLYAPDREEDRSAFEYTPTRKEVEREGTRNTNKIDMAAETLAGQRSVPGRVLNDPAAGIPKVFFVFNNLSVRIHGEYRLCFDVVNLSR
jgi:hypothetical protein